MKSYASIRWKITSQIESNRLMITELFTPFVDFAGRTVLELGCNKGYLLNSFLQLSEFRAIDAEIHPEALKIAEANYGERITFIRTSADRIPLPDESVDVIYTIDTVEHLSSPSKIFSECFRVLRPGGMFLVHFEAWLTPYGSGTLRT
jgi:ubiquinone/menaquinone biosynthesis C-methylase UbiE